MTETIDNAQAVASTLFLGHNGEWWDFWLICAVIFAALAAIAIGVTTAGSIISHTREAASAEQALEAYKLTVDDKVADAKKEGIAAGKSAGDALLKAAELEKQAEQLRKDTAEANARAAEANLELAKFKAPRVLDSAQQSIVAGKVAIFSGTKFDGGIGPKGDPEPLYLLRSISDSLRSVGWVHVPWTGDGETYTEAPLPAVGLTMVTNVIVDVHPEYWNALGPAANALVRALNDEGIAAIANSKPTTIHTEVIHIRIGRKL